MNSDVYNINTRQKLNFHQPLSNLSLYHKLIYALGVKVLNDPPPFIKNRIDNIKQFK